MVRQEEAIYSESRPTLEGRCSARVGGGELMLDEGVEGG